MKDGIVLLFGFILWGITSWGITKFIIKLFDITNLFSQIVIALVIYGISGYISFIVVLYWGWYFLLMYS
ncbi:MAG: hypothetical protein ACRC7R_03440 [Sarcina sp.]